MIIKNYVYLEFKCKLTFSMCFLFNGFIPYSVFVGLGISVIQVIHLE